MKSKIHSILLLLMMISLSACGKKTDVVRPAEKLSGVKGGWKFGTNSYLFDISAGSSSGLQGTVKIVDGSTCKKASLRISDYKPGWLKADWDKSKLVPCLSEITPSVEIPNEYWEKIAGVTSDMSKLQLPSHFVIYNLPSDKRDLAPIIFGTASVLLGGSKPTGLRPVLKVGAAELKGIVIHEKVLKDPWAFEKLESPISVTPLQLDAEDAELSRKGGKAFCLNQVMPFETDDEKHRTIVLTMLRNVMNNEIQSYQSRDEEAACLR